MDPRRLFEFTDQTWLPRIFRELMTEVLQHQIEKYDVYQVAVPKLNDALRRCGRRAILDLCSGSGGPLPSLLPHLDASALTLSDQYPSRRAVEKLEGIPGITYLPYPVDARAVPSDLEGCRTLFTSFHHFSVADARRILKGAANARAPVAIFEITDRAFANLRGLFTAAITVWRDTWDLHPRRWSRLFWTYVIPVVPLIYAWDAVVSHRRSYTPTELSSMTSDIPGYKWEAGHLVAPVTLARITYLIGKPAA